MLTLFIVCDCVFQDNMGRIPLHLSINGEKEEYSHLLVDHGTPLDIQDVEGITVLHVAAGRGQYEMVEALLGKGCTLPIDSFRKSQFPLKLDSW